MELSPIKSMTKTLRQTVIHSYTTTLIENWIEVSTNMLIQKELSRKRYGRNSKTTKEKCSQLITRNENGETKLLLFDIKKYDSNPEESFFIMITRMEESYVFIYLSRRELI